MKPYVICHMISSLDGGLHPSRWSQSPDGDRGDWSRLYEEIHQDLAGDAWIVGRVTMAEMTRAEPHPPARAGAVDRRRHVAAPGAESYGIALDPGGRLHFSASDIGGDHVIVVLGPDVSDSHLAELVADGVSYLVSDSAAFDLGKVLERLADEFGIRRLLIEGGAGICGSFLATGLVDEFSLLVAPALDGRVGHQTIIEFGDVGGADKVRLTFSGCDALQNGLVHLRYAVTPP